MKKRHIAIFLLIALGWASCKKDDHEETHEKVTLHLHTMVGSKAADYTSTFTSESGRAFTLSDLRYYLSNFVLIKEDGSEVPIAGTVILASPNEHEWELGTAPSGHYSGIRFLVGLDSVTNHGDPSVYPANHPLAPQTPSIHWSWNTGYIFMKIEGKVDTTLSATGTPNADFYYHIGLDQMAREVTIRDMHVHIEKGGENSFHVAFDLLKALKGVDMRTERATHTMDNMMLAQKIADNWPESFSAE
ncbi:MAG: hypothetical protein NZL95_09245 [Chitinophagales bacterium]|nr:hypothetical protein [Chitinophagales bacterium]MDW8428718.1 hypothetical protein [Chitinophagales bacterium]